jgi:hypothetical protein
MADAGAVREAVRRAEERLRELINEDGDWLRAMRTAYAEFKAHAALTWFAGTTGEALRRMVQTLWDDNGGPWEFVPALERSGENSMCQLLADCADLNKNSWDPYRGNYFPNFDENRVDIYVESEDDGQDAGGDAQGGWGQEEP